MKTKLIIHPDELNKEWVLHAHETGIDVIGIHSVGNVKAHVNLANDLNLFTSPNFMEAVDLAYKLGMAIEYEVHAVSYLLPRELFETHPEYFRMDENGVRTNHCNFCASSEESLNIIAKNAVKLAKLLYRSTSDYYFWTDDIKGAYCKCEKCKDLSPSDQNLILMNAIIKELRKDNPKARIAYLAYYDSVDLPTKIKPEDGVFLEYAPYERDLFKPASIVNSKEINKMKRLLKFFGKENSTVLEYWVDNSYFSKYEKPPKKLTPNNQMIKEDIKFYRDIGFENISSFACFLGDDYKKLFGKADLSAFKK